MPRAKRFFIPGYAWHLTHRCHGNDFLLKFAKDRDAWKRWLFEARKRFGLDILDYKIMSNHIHLAVWGKDDLTAIPRGMQLLAGRTAQEYNSRKKRNGAFWENRYHVSAIETGTQLRRCLLYIDMNPVRVGMVRHPTD